MGAVQYVTRKRSFTPAEWGDALDDQARRVRDRRLVRDYPLALRQVLVREFETAWAERRDRARAGYAARVAQERAELAAERAAEIAYWEALDVEHLA